MANEFTLFNKIVDKLMTASTVSPKEMQLFNVQLKSETIRIAHRFDKAALFGDDMIAESKFMQEQAIHLFQLYVKLKRLSPEYRLLFSMPLENVIQKMKYYYKVRDEHFMDPDCRK